MSITKSISTLRKRIPIGILKAKELLLQYNNDLSKAEQHWKDLTISALSEKCTLSKTDAQNLLELKNYEIDKAISVFKRYKTPIVEQILAIEKDRNNALSNFSQYCRYHFGNKEYFEFWTHSKKIKNLPPLIQDILLVEEWYKYYSVEDYSVEQVTTEKVIEIIKTKLNLASFAETLEAFYLYVEKYYEDNFHVDSVERSNKLSSCHIYQKYKKQIDLHEEITVNALTEYILENKDVISKLLAEDYPNK